MAKILLSGHGTSRDAAALNTNTLHGLLKSHCLMYGLHTSHYSWMYAMEFGAKTYDPVRHVYLCFPRIHNADVAWICTACQYMIFIDLHILTYMSGLICSESIAYRCGNAFLTHTRLQSLLMPLRGNTYVFTCSGRAKSRNTCTFPCFFSKQQETHARSTPTFSHLLLNNRKRQDLKSCSVALCAITFQLQPCFPRNCAPLEQKNCPAIEKHPFPGQKTAIVANFFVFV